MKSKKYTRRDVLKASGLSLAALTLPAVAAGAKEFSRNSQKIERVAFVTGGARGIGLKIAETFAGQGVHVVIFDIASQINSIKYPLSTKEDLLNAERKIGALGVKCLAIQGDVRNLEDLTAAVDKTIAAFGRLDYVIANAAVTRIGLAESYDAEIVTDMLEVNTGGVLKTIQAVIPVFKKQKSGRIVTLSSVAGRGGAYLFSLYAASKWAVIGLSKTIAQELGSYNVTCNTICPTLVRTPMVDNEHILQGMNRENPTIEGATDFFRGMHTLPVGILEPKEIADAVKFLCSDEASHISGIVLDVSAGYTAGNTA
jgi:NAD(P)-dependent dehydrogenase (short-subunit alcohol dehydrogenase family)